MWKVAVLFVGLVSALVAQTIREFILDPYQAIELPVSREVTTVTLPAPITAVAAADMLIESGGAAVEVEEGVAADLDVHAELDMDRRLDPAMLAEPPDQGAEQARPRRAVGARTTIGAGSVVTEPVPADVFAAGNPCRVIRELER